MEKNSPADRQTEYADDRSDIDREPSDSDLFDSPVQRMSDSFEMRPVSSAGKRPVSLTGAALKKVIVQFERQLATPITYQEDGKKMSYAEVIFCQARQYRLYVEGNRKSYQPLQMR